jgi:hypothetical protein
MNGEGGGRGMNGEGGGRGMNGEGGGRGEEGCQSVLGWCGDCSLCRRESGVLRVLVDGVETQTQLVYICMYTNLYKECTDKMK